MNIFIFKTNIDCKCKIESVKKCLALNTEIKDWSIDIEDCDKVLRIVSKNSTVQNIINQIQSINIQIAELE